MDNDEKLIITKKGNDFIKLQELKEKHPLIKDTRCFDFNWWIDPIPECLRGDE